MLLNEKPTKWFFSETKYASEMTIEAVRDEHDVLQTTSLSILRTAADFYEKLYAHKPSNKRAARRVVNCIRSKISQSQAESLTRAITAKEIRSSIKRAAVGKSPRDDRLPCEFYEAMLRHRQRLNEDDTPVMLLLKL